MNRRIIANILKSKHKEFVESIDNPEVKALVDKNSIITGGSIASLLTGETVKDFDYYFTDAKTVYAVAQYYVKKFNDTHPDITIQPRVSYKDGRIKIVVQSAGVVSENKNGDDGYKYFEQYPNEVGMDYIDKILTYADETNAKYLEEMEAKNGKYRPVFMSANAITLSDKVQLVTRFYGNPEEIHKNYDFIHCCNYWTSADNKLVLHPAAIESLLNKELQYQGSLYPICSIIRARKFLQRGWYINAGQYLKMCFQISELDLKDVAVLEDQLTGVDAAYFFQVIEYCKKRQAEDPKFEITTPYLITVIDKIFG